jgi:Phage tail baseplate hub (GPD)
MCESMTMSAGLGTFGEIQLSQVRRKVHLKPKDLQCESMTVTVQRRDDAKRYFHGYLIHGYLTRLGIGAYCSCHFGYRASMRPWLWFLTRAADCRTFLQARRSRSSWLSLRSDASSMHEPSLLNAMAIYDKYNWIFWLPATRGHLSREARSAIAHGVPSMK